MAGKKPIPGHDVEMGGAAGGGLRGSTIRPLPKGGGSYPAPKGGSYGGGNKVKLNKHGWDPPSKTKAKTKANPNRKTMVDKGGGSKAHKLKTRAAADAKAKKVLREMAAKESKAKFGTTAGKSGIRKYISEAKAKRVLRKMEKVKKKGGSDAMADFVLARGPAVPESLKKMSREMRREVWSRIPEAKQMDVWGSMKSTPRTSVMQHGGSGKPTSHAQSHQIIEKAVADVKAGKPAPMTAHQQRTRHIKAGKAPKTVYKNNPNQMKSARKAAKASSAYRRGMIDPDSVPF